jgi:hypothetical protein
MSDDDQTSGAGGAVAPHRRQAWTAQDSGTLPWLEFRPAPDLFTGLRLVLMAGFLVIMAGVLCLCLSGMVAATGSWWQGTLDAFGVGLVVGGLIDVLAIFGLNQFLAGKDQRRQKNNRKAREILTLAGAAPLEGEDFRRLGEQALELALEAGSLMDKQLLEQLLKLVNRVPAVESGRPQGRQDDNASPGT